MLKALSLRVGSFETYSSDVSSLRLDGFRPVTAGPGGGRTTKNSPGTVPGEFFATHQTTAFAAGLAAAADHSLFDGLRDAVGLGLGQSCV